MIKKLVCFALCCLLITTVNSSFISAQSKNNKDSSAAKIKAKIVKRGTGEKKRVAVRMSDGTKLKGYINQIGEDSCDLKNSKTGQIKTVAYENVEQVTGSGSNIGLIVGLSVVAAAAVIVVYYFSAICHNEGC